MKISSPVNPVQEEFNRLCDLSGGPSGGPAPVRVRELLRSSGKKIIAWANQVMEEHMGACEGLSPWHVCFAFGLIWGHLAKPDAQFTKVAARVLADWNSEDLNTATSFCMERGPEPIEKSLIGGYRLFEAVRLPPELPDSLPRLKLTQDRWLGRIIGPDRPPYIGSWNATAMFMSALFAKPELGEQLVEPGPLLPPGGPAFNGLRILHKAGVLATGPDGSELDDGGFEPGIIYTNNDLMATLRRDLDDWSLLDVHGGLYMLGTRQRLSGSW